MNTCIPCRPVSAKNVVGKAPSEGTKPSAWYSRICRPRKVRPITSVRPRPRIRPSRRPRDADTSAQCMVNDEATRMAVLMPVVALGISKPPNGYSPWLKRM